MDKLEQYSAIELGRLISGKQYRPTEVIRYFLDRVEERNKSINAFVYLRPDEALEEAREVESRIMRGESTGPLEGVPIALKDFLPEKKGWPATHGGVKSLQTIDCEDGAVYKAAKKLGCIAIGKTNAPSFGFRGTTDNKMYGPTSTPFKPGYNSGGSSGGSAAAVGDRMVPLAQCGDAGGSTRIPAAWCNCFGFKASAGLIPSVCRPDAWTATHPYCCTGVVSRTVDDSAIILDNMIRYNPKDPISIPWRKKNALQRAKHLDIKGMRIAVTHDYNLFPEVDVEIKDAVDSISRKLEGLGAFVDYYSEFELNFSLDVMLDAWLLGISIDDAATPEIIQIADYHPEDLPDEFIEWHMRARKASIVDYRKFHEVRTDILDEMLKIFDRYDILISPVTCCMPVKNSDDFNTRGPEEINGVKYERLIGFTQTWMHNMTGYPAASVPAGISNEGFPMGVQVIGRRYSDEDVFAVAYALEQVLPWEQYYKGAL